MKETQIQSASTAELGNTPLTLKQIYVLGVLLIAYIFAFADRQIMSLLVEPIKQDLGITDFQMSLLQGWAFSLFYAVLGIPIANLADRMNRRNIIASGVALWSLMTALCGLARSFGGLFLARVGVGVGEAALSPPAHSLLSDYFSAKRLPLAMAVYNLGISIGVGLAFLVGGLVVSWVMTASTLALPFVGEIRSWQAAFLIVGLPGLLVALLVLTIREPERKGHMRDAGGETVKLPFKEVLRFILHRRRLYLPLFFGIAMVTVYSYGLLSWYPTFLIRTYGMAMSDAGIAMGVIYIVFGLLGTLSGPYFARWYERRGHTDGQVRLMAAVAIGSVVPGILGPLMPNALLALTVLAPLVYIKAAYLGSSAASLQLVTPNQIRAQISAINIFVNNIIGMGVGATLVAVFTDFVFGSEDMLRYSLVCTAIISSCGAWILLRSALGPYRKGLAEARTWQ